MESSRIFVRNLPSNFSESEFKTYFSERASITDTKFIPQRRIGYVGYKTPTDAAKAVKYHNKSFIRMSRIGVEIARSIDEQYALNLGVKRKRGSTQNGEPNNVSQKVEDKRKNEIEKAGDKSAKLQEFLKVMQPHSKAKAWEDQAASVRRISVDLGAESENHKVSTNLGDADAQPVLKKSKRSFNDAQKVEHGSLSTQTEDDLSKELRSEPKTENVENEDVPIVAENRGGESDSDWLRSRTSRLLGLVDDDQMCETAAMPLDDEAKNLQTIQPPSDAKRGVPGLNMQGEEEIQEANALEREKSSPREEDSHVNTTAENGRLFIRNLTYSTTEDELRRLFEIERYGSLEEVSSLSYNRVFP